MTFFGNWGEVGKLARVTARETSKACAEATKEVHDALTKAHSAGETVSKAELKDIASELSDPHEQNPRTFSEPYAELVDPQPLPADFYGKEGTEPAKPAAGKPGNKS